jgi:hypothetical protein
MVQVRREQGLHHNRHIHSPRTIALPQWVYIIQHRTTYASPQSITSNTPDPQAAPSVLQAAAPSPTAAAQAFQKAAVREKPRRADRGSPAWDFGAVSNMRDRWLMQRTVRASPVRASARGIDSAPAEAWRPRTDTAEVSQDHVLAVCWCMAATEAASSNVTAYNRTSRQHKASRACDESAVLKQTEKKTHRLKLDVVRPISA